MHQTFKVKINGKATVLSRLYVRNLLQNSGKTDADIINDMASLDDGGTVSLKVDGVVYEVVGND